MRDVAVKKVDSIFIDGQSGNDYNDDCTWKTKLHNSERANL